VIGVGIGIGIGAGAGPGAEGGMGDAVRSSAGVGPVGFG
jgi:hypothetical protein